MKKYIKSMTDAQRYGGSNYDWQNFGDSNFLDGGCVIQRDDSMGEDVFHVIMCDFVYDVQGPNHYLLQDCYVDINDSWIDQADVERSCGCSKAEDPEWFAEGCVRYYGGENFGAEVPPRGLDDYTGLLYTAQEVEDYMSSFNLPADIYFSES